MSLITNKNIVIKTFTKEALICDRPCWLYWFKGTESWRMFPEMLSLYDLFFVTDLERQCKVLDLTTQDILRFKVPLRFNKALYCIPEGFQFRGSLGFIPDY